MFGAALATLNIIVVPLSLFVFNLAVAWLGIVLFMGGDGSASEQASRVS
jgi:hypothetical protein